MTDDLKQRLRDLANCRHDDLSIGYEAADRIEQLETERDQLREQVKVLRDAIKFWMKAEGTYDLMKADKLFQEAIAATEPKA